MNCSKDAQVSLNLLSPQDVSEILGITRETLAVWRCTKRYNLPYVKIGGRIRYSSKDLDKFIQSRTCNYHEVRS